MLVWCTVSACVCPHAFGCNDCVCALPCFVCVCGKTNRMLWPGCNGAFKGTQSFSLGGRMLRNLFAETQNNSNKGAKTQTVCEGELHWTVEKVESKEVAPASKNSVCKCQSKSRTTRTYVEDSRDTPHCNVMLENHILRMNFPF